VTTTNPLDSPVYAVQWELTRLVRPPCREYTWRDGFQVFLGHFLTPDGGCFYGCEETP
jgi:predicted secreted hydrolase